MAAIELRAINRNVGSQRTYAQMEITVDTTGEDISDFVSRLIGNVTTPSIKLEFRGDDDCSSILTIPVTIPTENDSDNGDAPICTIMSEDDVDVLYRRVIEESYDAAMSICWDCPSEGAEFVEIAYTLEELR